MITIGRRLDLAPEVVSSMHELRHEIFVRRLGWSLPLIDGIERDEYDHQDAMYVVARDVDGNITACARLIPTVSRCMLTDLFSELLGDQSPPNDPSIWELSRFTSTVKTGEGRVISLSQPTLDLLGAILAYAGRHAVRRLVLVTSIAIERLLLRAGFDVHRVAAPARIDERLCVALYIEVPGEGAGRGDCVDRKGLSWREAAAGSH